MFHSLTVRTVVLLMSSSCQYDYMEEFKSTRRFVALGILRAAVVLPIVLGVKEHGNGKCARSETFIVKINSLRSLTDPRNFAVPLLAYRIHRLCGPCRHGNVPLSVITRDEDGTEAGGGGIRDFYLFITKRQRKVQNQRDGISGKTHK